MSTECKLWCRIVYPLCLLLFNFGKISMYYLFTYRIDLIFKHTVYEISPLPLTVYRILCAIVPTTFWVIWIYLSWDDLTPHDTDSTNPQYQYCFPKEFKDQHLKLSAITSVCDGIADMVFSGILFQCFLCALYIAIRKLIQFEFVNRFHRIFHSPKSKNLFIFQSVS